MPASIFSIAGPGAVQCIQGLVTNDVEKAPEGAAVYGALLTPKGLIILDCWIIRLADRILFITDATMRATALDIFRKQLPPRLARVADLSDDWRAWRLFGGASHGISVMAPAPAVLARPANGHPFAALLLGPPLELGHALKELAMQGVRTASPDEWHGARVLAGWPQLGAEIDEKTLVQEVRFDENGGVSYEKGCYTGQETVARLHFRGHTNRDLRGVVWNDGEAPVDARIVQGEKEVGSVRSILSLPTRRLGLALIRREVETGSAVLAGGVPATVVALPFDA